jgi:NAD(P)-dependent dehydrogenase (short-subunit alcohol dehydrogenase family)
VTRFTGAGRHERHRRNACSDEAAGAIVLLASPLARFCTGAFLAANGGVSMT